VRAALGAGRKTIAAELLRECLVLGLLGGAAGLALAHGGIELLAALTPPNLPRAEDISLDAPVLVFAVVAALASSAAFGSIPALKHSFGPGPIPAAGTFTRLEPRAAPHATCADGRAGGAFARAARRRRLDDPHVPCARRSRSRVLEARRGSADADLHSAWRRSGPRALDADPARHSRTDKYPSRRDRRGVRRTAPRRKRRRPGRVGRRRGPAGCRGLRSGGSLRFRVPRPSRGARHAPRRGSRPLVGRHGRGAPRRAGFRE